MQAVHVQVLTQGCQVIAGESAEVEVKALQVREVRQVEGEMVQSSSQTLVTGQVQLSESREGAERTTCRTRREGGGGSGKFRPKPHSKTRCRNSNSLTSRGQTCQQERHRYP